MQQDRSPKVDLKYSLSDDKLTIWWNNSVKSQYRKSEFRNSLDMTIAEQDVNLNLPAINHYKVLSNTDLCLNVFVGKNALQLGAGRGFFNDFEKLLKQEKAKISLLDIHLTTVCLFIDKETSMEKIHTMKQILRQNGMLKVALMGKSDSDEISELMSHTIGIPKKLPTMDVEEIDFEKLKEGGANLLVMNPLVDKILDAEKSLKKLIKNSKKYVLLLEYNDKTSYEQYVAYTDMIFTVIFEFRNQQAHELYSMSYDDLSVDKQKEIRKMYPITLTEKRAEK